MGLFQRHEGKIAFIIACLVATLCFASCTLMVGAPQSAGWKHEKDNGAGNAECDALLRPLGIIPAAREGKTKPDAIKQDRYVELCQQARSASGTKDTANYTWWQLVFGGGSLILVFVATVFAGRAAHWTKDTARSAKRSADVERGFILAAVKIDPDGYFNDDGRLSPTLMATAKIEIKNFGRSPVIIRKFEIGWHIGEISDNPTAPSDAHDKKTFSGSDVMNVGADQDIWLIRTVFNGVDYDAFWSGNVAIWIIGNVHYEDVYGEERITRLRWKYDRDATVTIQDGGKPHNERT